MHINRAILIAALMGLGAGTGFAADLPVKAPALAPAMVVAYSWTGFYIGGHAGGAWAKTDWTHTNTGGVVENFAQDARGFVYGGHAGAMYQFGNIVIGVEGTYSRLNDISATSIALLSTDRSNAFNMTDMATVVGRLGMAWDRWLVYGQGGWATVKTNFNRFATSTNATTASSSGWDNGWTAGVGAAYAVHQNIILGIEYNFARIEIDNRTNTLAAGFVGTDTVTNAKADLHQVTGRLSLKFP